MGSATARQGVSAEGIDFIRYCYGRRKAGWPEIYDEMCAVASRGLFRGWSHEDLAAHGIAFSLAGLPALAAVVRQTIEAEPLPRPVVRRGGTVRVVADEGSGEQDVLAAGTVAHHLQDGEAPSFDVAIVVGSMESPDASSLPSDAPFVVAARDEPVLTA